MGSRRESVALPSLLLWLTLLVSVALCSWLIDSQRYRLEGLSTQYLLRIAYMLFTAVVMTRFISFRSDGGLEKMLASYKNLSGVDASQYTIFSVRPLGLWYYVALLICAVGAAFSLLLPSAYAFFAGNILDTGIWLLLLTWVVWTHLLKSTRRKELLKEMLDDARSKSSLPLKPSEPEFHYGLYALFGVVVAALILGISYLRVSKSQGVYSLNTLKKCIQTTKTLEVNHFLSTGKYGSALHQSQCIDEFSKELTINVVFQSAELELFAQEKNFSDFFENSRKGDQYLSLGANGKFSIR